MLDFIKRVWEGDKICGFAEHLSAFPIEFRKFSNSEGRMECRILFIIDIKISFCSSEFYTKNVTMSPLENTTFVYESKRITL